MNLKTTLTSLALICSVAVFAQTRSIKGTVSDKSGPIVGAAVIQQGTTNGQVTDVDGTFSLTVPQGDVTLDVSCLGYTSKTVVIKASQDKLDVILEDDNMLLEETVVVGYGTQKKVNLTGAITSVGQDELKDRTSHNLADMLQGSVPGLNISTSSGNPGSVGSLNIRGTTSINGASPLVLIDGAVGELDRVNSNDVESISVIKDAAAAAVYGARAAYGVILVTTKSGKADEGKFATVKLSARAGWERPTTSTDYETRGYWSVFTVDTFWATQKGAPHYTTYTADDMKQLLARINDKSENPARPWAVEQMRNGKNQWIYYCNTDWYHEMYRDRHPVQQYNVSVSGGSKNVKYYISGGYDRQSGIIKQNPDVFNRYNMRAKIDAKLAKWATFSENASFYSSDYNFVGVGNVQNCLQYSARHALASFPLKNPDGSWLYSTPLINGYNVANGRHIVNAEGKDVNVRNKSDFANTAELRLTPVKGLSIVANYTYRLHQTRSTSRQTNFEYREYPGAELDHYTTGAGEDGLSESISTYNYHAANIFATYENTFKDAHHLTVTAGWNFETQKKKTIGATGKNLLSEYLNDLQLIGPDATGAIVTTAIGGQTDYALMGYFGRINYDFKGRYLFELAGRYDGTSRFAKGHKWGFFPSGSLGWRISEEPFFKNARPYVNNLKLRASVGTLGNQNVDNYSYLREISIKDLKGYTFGESTAYSKYSSIGAPKASDLTWETTYQYNLGLDVAAFKNRLNFTGEVYIRDTKNMLTDGMSLPAVYGADAPKSNSADLRTRGYELSISWKDQFNIGSVPFGYFVKASMSNYDAHITRYNSNANKLLGDYYEGMRIGDIWGVECDGLFQSDEEAADYMANVCNLESTDGDLWGIISNRMVGGFKAGDMRFVDLDGDKIITYGQKDMVDENGNPVPIRSLKNHGDFKILGNSLASLQYGITLGFDVLGFDFSMFLQGTGNHYWYPAGMNYSFWGAHAYPYASYIPKNFYTEKVWTPETPDNYFPTPHAYCATGGELSVVNSRYLQNIRYLRLKNLTVGYTLPQKATRKAGMDRVRVYFAGENLGYASPMKKITKYLDPESAFDRNGASFGRAANDAADQLAYSWQKSFMFGIDITF